MAGDILYDPLGQTPERPPRRSRAALAIVACAVLIVAAAGAGWLWFVKVGAPPPPVTARVEPQPRPASPQVLPRPADPPPAPTPSPPPIPASPPPPPGPRIVSATEVDRQSGVLVNRPGGLGAGGAKIIKITPEMAVSLAPAPDPRLIEPSTFGPLPRRGADGSRPADVYARPVVPDGTLPDSAPRIAIVVGGMGTDGSATLAAAGLLPGAVTFAFTPSGTDLEAQVRSARDLGHEVVLEVPLGSVGRRGGQTLVLDPAAATSSVIDQLHRMMGRCTGYVAIAMLGSGSSLSDQTALRPALSDVAERGLFLLAPSSGPALEPEASRGMPVVKADAVLDGHASDPSPDAALDEVVLSARKTGSAVVLVNGRPEAIDAVARVAAQLAAHGVRLVPLSAFATSGVPRPAGATR